jgi:hypothetical protein
MSTISRFILYNHGGVPLVSFQFDNNPNAFPEVLLSGFLSAITGVSNQLFEVNADRFYIDNGTKKINLFCSPEIFIAVLGSVQLMHLQHEFMELIHYFVNNYDINHPALYEREELGDFYRKVIRVLFRYPIAEDWVVNPQLQTVNYAEVCQKYPLISQLVPNTQIRDQPSFDRSKLQEIYEILNYARYYGVLIFDNDIEPRDYIIGNVFIRSSLNLEAFPLDRITSFARNINALNLMKALTNVCRVSNLIEEFGESVIFVLKNLNQEGYLDLLDEKSRRIYIVIDIANDMIRELYDVEKSTKVSASLRSALDQFARIDLQHLVEQDKDQRYYIKRSNDLLNIAHEETMNVKINSFTEFNLALLVIFNENFPRKMNKHLEPLLKVKYSQLIHDRDIDLLIPLLMKFDEFTK